MWDGINRRKFTRANYQCRIFIKEMNATEPISTMTENVGAGGICVILAKDLGLFKEVSLEVSLEDNQPPISSPGTVVWVVKKRPDKKGEPYMYDTGIEFIDLDDKNKERLLKIVNSILKKEAYST